MGARGDVSCNKAESLGVSPLTMSWHHMKADSDWFPFLSVGEESSGWGSTDDSLDDLDAGGEYDGDLGECSHWGDGDEWVSDVCQVHQITWIWHPCSWCLSVRTQFSPLLAWGLERSWLQASFPLFSLDGLEMTYHHSKWVLSELCFSCRLWC